MSSGEKRHSEPEPEPKSGGRNQEFALAVAIDIAGQPGIVTLSGGTDGTDGTTQVAGAIVDGLTDLRGRKLPNGQKRIAKKDLSGHDAHGFFKAVGGLLDDVDQTNTNVMDLRIVLVASQPKEDS